MEAEGRAALGAGRVWDPGQAESCFPDILKLGGPGPMLLDLVQMTTLSCLMSGCVKEGAVGLAFEERLAPPIQRPRPPFKPDLGLLAGRA